MEHDLQETVVGERPENAETRSSYRCPVPEGHNRGRLFIEEQAHPATLVDESAGGFNIAVRSNVQVLTGQQVVLQLPAGWYECEVRRSQRNGDEVQIGLKRVRDLPPPDDSDHSRKGGSVFTYGTFMQLGAVALGAAIASVGLFQANLIPDGWKFSSRSIEPPRTLISTEYSANVPDHQTTRILVGFNSLTDAHMARALKLSNEQVRNLDTVYADASKQLGMIYEKAGKSNNANWQRESALVVQRTLQRVLCLLTDEQIRSWQQTLQRGG